MLNFLAGQQILVKAPLRVLYNKIQHEAWGQVANTAWGKAKCCVCHETPPQMLCFIIQHKYTLLLLICWFCMGELITSIWASICLRTTLTEWIHKEMQLNKLKQSLVYRCCLSSGKWTMWEFYNPNFDFMQDSEWLPPVTKRKSYPYCWTKEKEEWRCITWEY